MTTDSLRRWHDGLQRTLGAAWRFLRTVSGDDAYERYLEHHAREHAGQRPMSPRAFYEESQRRKWSGVSRCC